MVQAIKTVLIEIAVNSIKIYIKNISLVKTYTNHLNMSIFCVAEKVGKSADGISKLYDTRHVYFVL